MATTQFPVFVEGQTLTDADLNLLREYLVGRDRTLGRLVGFGVGCGLGGSVAGDSLHITAGLAVDHLGEALLLPAEVTIALPPTPAGAFDFVSGTDGFTVVLTASDTAQLSAPCPEAGCDGHAELHVSDAKLNVVAGRLTATGVDFSTEPLLGQRPVAITKTGNVDAPFVGLRDAIVARIKDRIAPDLLAKLATLAIDTTKDLQAVRAAKAAFLNQVFFASLDLLRCEALKRSACLRSSTTPGVALGWLHQVAGAWTWDCGYRHSWEPLTGLVNALSGGPCTSPCQLFVERLESIIDTFEPPVAPAPADPPKHGGIDIGDYHICKTPGKKGCPDYLPYPKLEIPPDWADPYINPPVVFDPVFIEPPRPIELVDTYGIDPPDPVNAGWIDMTPSVGARADGVKVALEKVIEAGGGVPDVRTVTMAEAEKLGGFAFAKGASPADIVVLVADEQNKVVATGHVPANESLRAVGTVLPQVTAAATSALAEATQLKADLGTVNARLTTIDTSIGDLGKFKDDTTTWRGETADVLKGMDAKIVIAAKEEFADFQIGFATEFSTAVTESVEKIRTGIFTQVQSEIDARMGAKLDEVTATIDTRLDDTANRIARVEGRFELSQKQLDSAAGRIDQLFTRSPVAGGVSPRDAGFADGLVKVLGTIRTAVEKTAPDPQAEDVRTALAAGDEAMAALTLRAQAGIVERDTLAAVVDSLAGGLAAAGAPAATIRDLRKQIDSLQKLGG